MAEIRHLAGVMVAVFAKNGPKVEGLRSLLGEAGTKKGRLSTGRR